MKLITKETDYAIRAVIQMAGTGKEYVSSRDIASEQDIPLHFLRRILQGLTKAGLVDSKEGISGGVRLRARAEDIHLDDLVRIFQGDIQLSDCMFRKRICSNRETCVLRKRIKKIDDMVTEQFKGITIADLLQDQEVER
jgi:Rrf2 family cysteine metabolism transcriptional repressor